MAKGARSHVIPSDGGWAIKPSGASREHIFRTKKEAVQAARTFVKNRGGGEVFIHDRSGRIRDADTIGKGHEGRKVKDPAAGGRLTKAEIQDAVWNGSKALRAAE